MKTFIIAAVTADGFIGKTADHLADWTSPEDKKLFVRLTKRAGVMVMGARTFETIGRALPGRRTIVYTHHPERITAAGVETTAEPPAELVKRLRAEGAPGLAICGGAAVYSQFLEAGAVDELHLTVEPILFGEGIKLLNQPAQTTMSLIHFEPLGEHTIYLHYVLN